MRLQLFRAVTAVVFIGIAVAAQAHAHLQLSVPATGQSVAGGPGELRLDFSEAIDIAFSGARLLKADGTAVATGPARLDGDKRIVVPIAHPLAAGIYTVEWHALAADGHKTQGRYAFTVTP